ncbi:hypothetical protein MK489_12910 [Myxococcota bacterium]|nr:hypothetical protein [Myxococcota bacterium]
MEDRGRDRPFMRGILVHSLMARGVEFEEAYRVADTIKQRFRTQGTVDKPTIVAAIHELLGEDWARDDHQIPRAVDITITGSGKRLPFSKGILSQSLLAAAIDPSDAFDVARSIERELVVTGTREVDREKLRSLVVETLSRQMGPRTAERYLVWRSYQEPERPALILLGGAAGVGKTSLALEVAHRLGIGRVLSTDSVRQIMRMMLARELVPALHGSSYEGAKLLSGDSFAGNPVIHGFLEQATAVSVGVRASMDRAVEENANLVLDGVSLVPGLPDLRVYEDVADVIFLVVASLDVEAFEVRFEARAAGEHRRARHRYHENLSAILEIQEYFLSEAERMNVPIVDNVSFDRSVLLIIRHVTEALRKKAGVQPTR